MCLYNLVRAVEQRPTNTSRISHSERTKVSLTSCVSHISFGGMALCTKQGSCASSLSAGVLCCICCANTEKTGRRPDGQSTSEPPPRPCSPICSSSFCFLSLPVICSSFLADADNDSNTLFRHPYYRLVIVVVSAFHYFSALFR